jgi:hypothetical protein
MMQARTGRAYAILRSRSPLGEVRRELDSMKEAAGKPDVLAIRAHWTADAIQKGNGTGIPPTITALAMEKSANYIIKAEWSGYDNGRTASALDDVLGVSNDFFMPQAVAIYYGKNGGPQFQCLA